MTMQIELSELAAILRGNQQPASTCADPWRVGEKYFIRTVTYHYTGRLVAVHPQELVLSTAAWIADDGRFSDSLKSGEFNEVEPYPKDALVLIGRGSITDAVIITTDLPISRK